MTSLDDVELEEGNAPSVLSHAALQTWGSCCDDHNSEFLDVTSVVVIFGQNVVMMEDESVPVLFDKLVCNQERGIPKMRGLIPDSRLALMSLEWQTSTISLHSEGFVFSLVAGQFP